MAEPTLLEAPLLPKVPPATDKHTVHWFRKGLRLHDNPSLREGLEKATTFRCVFIIDPWFAGASNVGINKWRFLLQCLEDLDHSLRRLNSRLFVVRGQPADALPKLFREWGTTSLTFEEDPEPYGRVRDLNIIAMCKEIGIEVVSKVSHTLYKLDSIIEKNGGRAPLTYHQFQSVISGMEAPCPAEDCITELSGATTTPIQEDHDEKYGVPTLEELGFETNGLNPPMWPGGESEALARLERHLERKAWVASFGRPKMTPQSLLASQTGLSPYLRFGCLSTRLFYYQLTELYQKIKQSRPPLSLHGQLLWREFFYCAATKNPNFDKMVGNPICVQIPWDTDSEALAKWANGQTGYPWIDAIMIQLREEGWIHHLARHAVACFLTRGDLWLSWEEGMKVFEELLLDADWSVNAGTWMWLSCSSFFQQFFHCYCPVRFGRKADPDGEYIRRYIPVLRNYPTRFIHSPWLATAEIQQAACCTIGKDYPMPMVEHASASRANIQRIKQVYNQLAKFKPQASEEAVKGDNLSQIFAINNVIRPNAAVSSPSPNSIIQTVNHSNYFCSTPESEKSNHFYNTRQTQNEDPENHNDNSQKKKAVEDYGNCNKAATDVFMNKQQKSDMNPQNRNMPFNKIVVAEEKYESLKQTNAESYENTNNNQFGQISTKQTYTGMNMNYQNVNRQAGFYVENVNTEETYNMENIIDQNQQTPIKADSTFAFNKSDMEMSQHYSLPTSHTSRQPSSDTMYNMQRKSYCITKSQVIDTVSYKSHKKKSNEGCNNQPNFNQNMEENSFNNIPTHKICKEFHVRTQTTYMNKSQSYQVKDRYGGNNLKQDYFEGQICQPNVSSMHQQNSESQEDVSSLREYDLNEGQMTYLQSKESMMQGCSRPSEKTE